MSEVDVDDDTDTERDVTVMVQTITGLQAFLNTP
jgi:hypothetical protein